MTDILKSLPMIFARVPLPEPGGPRITSLKPTPLQCACRTTKCIIILSIEQVIIEKCKKG